MAKVVTVFDGFRVGDRVELHPATDAWMSGDRFGAVVKLTARRIHVKLDKSGRVLRLLSEDLSHT